MTPKEFARRRRQLMRMMGPDSVAILPTAPECIRNRDVEFPFRPDSDFYYLTGFHEPEAVLVLAPGREHGEFILFCRERDPVRETWTGRRAGPEGACNDYGADDAFPIGDIDDILPGLMEGRERVFYTMGLRADFDQRMLGWLNRIRAASRGGERTPDELIALEHLVHDMRLYKSASELRTMRKAARIAAAAHVRAMQATRPGLMEYAVEAEFAHAFRREGCEHAYSPIVGGGANGCILHYTENNARLNEGELLLIDAGAEHDYYASDITRTFPVGGRFSKPQRALYELVLDAQHAAIEEVRPGNHWNDPHDAAVKVLTKGLVQLGLLKGNVRKLVKDEAYKRFYMHRTGHWLGMDVHDVGDYKVGGEWRVLEKGMVMTVEPGLYIPAGMKGVAKKWWDIGIRIEDDVAVTKDGYEILSTGAPKAVDEIEAIVGSD
ncbi:Xaa-Pro aminopeptidase [Thiohalobacter sp. COW1]|uniref:Xaa-Pro aminopeptidase n=1 Tax=Thiohalobacter sp. COW1 TaxID=2795687 RepID=UPI0019163911|nr:Xaa-Pro aminopeptidase [Thiohalobacter sp. COW1]BCO32776.1 Xaa-Pro aminopeptidase [Thiohalobacter sp. COW1]